MIRGGPNGHAQECAADAARHRVTGERQGQSRGAGWEYVHVAIDDYPRVAYSKVHRDQKKKSAVAFLYGAVRYFNALGVLVGRVMTGNGSCYRSKKIRKACEEIGFKHLFTKPFTPQTNGKAERFIQTALREWAYAEAFETSEDRKRALPHWLHRYNWQGHMLVSAKSRRSAASAWPGITS